MVPGHSDGTVVEAGPINAALARGVLYTALSVGLQRPSDDGIDRLTSGPGRQALEAAAALIDGVGPPDGRVADAARRLARYRHVGAAALLERYERLFGHTARGLVCPFETEYGADDLFRQPQTLADITGYYRAFGLEPRPDRGERVDHVACECEFMAMLSVKEAAMHELRTGSVTPETAGCDETLEETCKAAKGFLRDHLARFGVAFSAGLAREEAGHFYGDVGALLRLVLEAECERLGITAGPAVLHLRSAAPDDVPMACGGGEELIQIQGLRAQT